MRGRAARLAAGLCVTAMVLAACTAGHSGLGSGDSPCYKALPTAAADLHTRGRLLGVRHIPASEVERLPATRRVPALETLGRHGVCAVAFAGAFGVGTVGHALVEREGRIAIVIVTEDGSRVLAAFVTHRLPIRFRHLI